MHQYDTDPRIPHDARHVGIRRQRRHVVDDVGARRDGADGGRAIAPARPSDDAVHVRTDGNTLEQTVTAVLAVVTPRLAAAGGRPG